MIFPVLFYYEREHDASNAFQDALRESLYTDQSWPGMSCALDNLSDCVVQPGQFGVDIYPAYVFLRRLDGASADAVMVKKIEGRELSTDEILSEIEDAYRAVFDMDSGSGFSDEDGDGKPDVQINLPSRPGFRLGSPLGAYFGCADVLPDWLCRIKMGYLLLFILLIALMAVIMKKA